MSQQRNSNDLLGSLAGGAILGAIVALVTAAVRRQQKKNAETPVLEDIALPEERHPESMVSLQQEASALGYNVQVRGTHILVSRNDRRLGLTVGSDCFVYVHMTRDLQPLDRMERLVRPVEQDGETILVPAELIEALR